MFIAVFFGNSPKLEKTEMSFGRRIVKTIYRISVSPNTTQEHKSKSLFIHRTTWISWHYVEKEKVNLKMYL